MSVVSHLVRVDGKAAGVIVETITDAAGPLSRPVTVPPSFKSIPWEPGRSAFTGRDWNAAVKWIVNGRRELVSIRPMDEEPAPAAKSKQRAAEQLPLL